MTWPPSALLRLTTQDEKRAAWAQFLEDLHLARQLAQGAPTPREAAVAAF